MSTARDLLGDEGPERVIPLRTAGRRWRRPAAALVALLAVGLVVYRVSYPGAGDTAGRLVTATVDRGPIEQTVTATGTLNPVSTVQVGTYVSGPIQAIDVDFNSPVHKGQRVAKIDPAPFLVKVRGAEANLANAQAKSEKDRADLSLKKLLLERNRILLGKSLIAQNDLDTAQSNYDQAVAQLALDEAGVAQAQASLDESRVNLAYTDIVSPVDGVVVSRNVDVGQTVAASFQTPTLFLIAENLAKMQVDTNVSESDVGRLREGQTASFSVDAYPDVRFQGRVAQVRNAPITVQNVVTYDVVIAVDNADLELKPGMTANVSITTGHRDQVLRVPLRALRFRPEQAPARPPGTEPSRAAGESAVFVVGSDGSPRRVELRVGLRDAQHAEVLEGNLHEGDQVALAVRREASDAGPQRPPSFAGGRRF